MPGILSDNAEQQIATGLAKLNRLAPGVTPGPRKRHVRPSRARCVLLEDLDECDDLFGDPSTAEAVLIRRGSNGRYYAARHESSGNLIKLNVVNWMKHINLFQGAYCLVESVGENEWEPYGGDCDETTAISFDE